MSPKAADGLDVSSLSPSDAAVAVRSFPRRFRALLTSGFDEDEDPEALVRRAPPEGGSSALEHAEQLARALPMAGRAVDDIVTRDQPVIHAGVIDERQRTLVPSAGGAVADVLDVLSNEAEALASRVEEISASDWKRTGQVPGGEDVTGLDVVREVVRTGASHLKEAERTLQQVRGR